MSRSVETFFQIKNPSGFSQLLPTFSKIFYCSRGKTITTIKFSWYIICMRYPKLNNSLYLYNRGSHGSVNSRGFRKILNIFSNLHALSPYEVRKIFEIFFKLCKFTLPTVITENPSLGTYLLFELINIPERSLIGRQFL